MILKIDYFVHGTTSYNEQHRAVGWENIPISELGLNQTQKVAQDLPEKKYNGIYSSDLLRAKQTANILFSSQKQKIYYDERLRECSYGSLSGEVSKLVNYSEHVDNPFPGGECLLDVQNRLISFIEEILSKGNLAYIAIAVHRSPQLAIDVIANNKSWLDAIAQNWRIVDKWQLGWQYSIDSGRISSLRK